MTENHPITPSKVLIEQLRIDCPYHVSAQITEWLATHAARWGYEQRGADIEAELQKARDEELEACCEWLKKGWIPAGISSDLRTARRPLSLAEEALVAWKTEDDAWPVKSQEKGKRFAIVRRALERLQELEGQAND